MTDLKGTQVSSLLYYGSRLAWVSLKMHYPGRTVPAETCCRRWSPV